MNTGTRTLGILALAGLAGLLGGPSVGVAIGVIFLGISKRRDV